MAHKHKIVAALAATAKAHRTHQAATLTRAREHFAAAAAAAAAEREHAAGPGTTEGGTGGH